MAATRALLALLVVVCAAAVAGCGAGASRPEITTEQRAATFTFDPAAAQIDRDAVTQAVAAARPEAQRLIGLVDGLVDIRIALTQAGSVGTTQLEGRRFLVTMNFGLVARRYGQRGISRVVLHELGHVVDFALLDDGLRKELDAGIPAGWGCDDGLAGSCAVREERFAETFAKWATNDIGVDLYIGYKVPPPSSLDAWGAPLSRLGAA